MYTKCITMCSELYMVQYAVNKQFYKWYRKNPFHPVLWLCFSIIRRYWPRLLNKNSTTGRRSSMSIKSTNDPQRIHKQWSSLYFTTLNPNGELFRLSTPYPYPDNYRTSILQIHVVTWTLGYGLCRNMLVTGTISQKVKKKTLILEILSPSYIF